VTAFITQHRGNIIDLEQHVDRDQRVFFMRIEWDLAKFDLEPHHIDAAFESAVGQRFGMTWRVQFSDHTPRMAVFVSKYPHCLHDVVSRWHAGEWDVELPLVISNHQDMREFVERFDIEYHHMPVTKDSKAEQEQRQIELLRERQIDVIVLARYMQILSDDFVRHYPNRVINIHHSFLPAFAGAKPYHAAYERGVKIIGATSHYVTAELDAGPIIEQDVVRVSHQDEVADLVRKGRDLEKIVLARAIDKHLQRKVLVYNNRAVVFH